MMVLVIAAGVLAAAALALLVLQGYRLLLMGRQDAPLVAMPPGALAAVLDVLELRAGDSVMDLGCGRGQVLEGCLRRQPDIRAVGVDHDRAALWRAAWRLRQCSGGAELRHEDLVAADLAGINKVVTYLSPATMARLEAKLAAALPPGARLVSVDFALPEKAPQRVIRVPSHGTRGKIIYVYEF